MEMEPEKILTIEEIIERDEKIEKLRKEFKKWHQSFKGTDSQYFDEFSEWVNKFKKYDINLWYADFSENPTMKNISNK